MGCADLSPCGATTLYRSGAHCPICRKSLSRISAACRDAVPLADVTRSPTDSRPAALGVWRANFAADHRGRAANAAACCGLGRGGSASRGLYLLEWVYLAV